MMIMRIPGFTRLLGKSQGYLGLPVKDTAVYDNVQDKHLPAIVTAWQPDPEELAALNEGASIRVQLIGTDICSGQHPPIVLSAGPVPE